MEIPATTAKDFRDWAWRHEVRIAPSITDDVLTRALGPVNRRAQDFQDAREKRREAAREAARERPSIDGVCESREVPHKDRVRLAKPDGHSSSSAEVPREPHSVKV
jgi:hypothetical protein